MLLCGSPRGFSCASLVARRGLPRSVATFAFSYSRRGVDPAQSTLEPGGPIGAAAAATSAATAAAAAASAPSASSSSAPVHLDHVVKRPRDSLCRAVLPFSSDARLRAAFESRTGGLRVGRLLEEIDAFAGAVAYTHCSGGGAGSAPLLVTASLDRVDALAAPASALAADITLTGMCSFTGASSLVVDVELARAAGGPALVSASLTFVARTAAGNAPLRVPRVEPGNAWEAAMHAAARAATAERRAARGASLDVAPPSASELAVVHSLFIEGKRLKKHGGGAGGGAPRLAGEGALRSTLLPMPQDRNLHGRVFGGWLMRQAFELAYLAAWNGAGAPPAFVAMDDVAFLVPVPVGCMLTFDAAIDFVADDLFSVTVTARMRDPDAAAAAAAAAGDDDVVSNVFHFVFRDTRQAASRRLVAPLYPRSYEDAMRYIEASRRAARGREIIERRAHEGVHSRFPPEEVERAGVSSVVALGADGAAALARSRNGLAEEVASVGAGVR